MAELKLPRLLAAAKEFNIGQDTLIEFLVKKGYKKRITYLGFLKLIIIFYKSQSM